MQSGLIVQRLCHSVLGRWTGRVIDVKSRELDIVEQRDTNLARLVVLF